jgi:hypothetical protein
VPAVAAVQAQRIRPARGGIWCGQRSRSDDPVPENILMRRVIIEKKRVRAGTKIRVACDLGADATTNSVGVWTRFHADDGIECAGDYSPHIAFNRDVVASQPQIYKPLFAQLHANKKHVDFEFVADEDMDVCVMEDYTFATDASAKARIYIHGSIAQKIRRCMDHCRTSTRRFHDAIIRANIGWMEMVRIRSWPRF